jgi:hypothetical protein
MTVEEAACANAKYIHIDKNSKISLKGIYSKSEEKNRVNLKCKKEKKR